MFCKNTRKKNRQSVILSEVSALIPKINAVYPRHKNVPGW